MALLDEIQMDLTNVDARIANTLRKALVLAHEIRSPELQQWAMSELNGYSDDDVPSYRQIHPQVFGTLGDRLGRTRNRVPIPIVGLPEKIKSLVHGFAVTDGVASLEQTIASGDPELYSPFIPEVAGLLSKELQLPNGATLLNAYQVIPSQQFSGVLDSVKTKLLAFVLELERSNVTPEAVSNGDVEPGLVRAAVSINIYGNNNVVASGQDIHQELKGIQKGDLDSLVGYLRFHNVCDEDLRELKDVVSVEPGPTNGGFGPKVSAFIGKLVEKAAGGTWKIGLEKASAVLGESFKTFYGI